MYKTVIETDRYFVIRLLDIFELNDNILKDE